MSHSQITRGRPSEGRLSRENAVEATEQELGRWLRECDQKGALPATEAAVDMAFARGYKKGLEEARGDHLDAMRTLVMRVMEAKRGPLDEEAFERIESANVAELQEWLVELMEASPGDAVGA